MPNGDEKNWVRLCAAVDGFRARHNAWPKRVRAYPASIENLRRDLFSPELYAQLTSKLELVPDEAGMIAEDDLGNSYDYGNEGSSSSSPDISAETWLGVRPDRLHH